MGHHGSGLVWLWPLITASWWTPGPAVQLPRLASKSASRMERRRPRGREAAAAAGLEGALETNGTRGLGGGRHNLPAPPHDPWRPPRQVSLRLSDFPFPQRGCQTVTVRTPTLHGSPVVL